MEEQWRDIIIEKNGVVFDYSGLYQVSNLGRVRSVDRVDSRGYKWEGKILKFGRNNKGYLYTTLSKNGKTKSFLIHRLVATMFIPNPDNLQVVNHRDENPMNCQVDNLEWCTQKYNINYGTCRQRASESMKGKCHSKETKQKMSESRKGKANCKKKVVCVETGQVFETLKQACEWCGLTRSGICSCLNGRAKKRGGYTWMYYDEWVAMAN